MIEKATTNKTASVCPVCLEVVEARRVTRGEDVFMVKECDSHGVFETVLWRGAPLMSEWRRAKEPVHAELCYGTLDKGCPYDCGLCADHRQLPCSVLIEVTDECNLRCAVCFADAGTMKAKQPSLEKITWQLERAFAAAGPSNLQLSGGEPTLRDDLPEIVKIARRIGYSFIQLNSNGIRLAADKEYLQRLSDAGLSAVFLQFDGVDDAVYRTIRGKALLDQKLEAIRNAGEAGLGVVLVPTLIQGVNTDDIGGIVRQALQLAPTVRGIHFQPVSYFGRYPEQQVEDGRFTLPELMRSLEEQTGGLLKVTDFSPPGCEHEHCSFHASYMFSSQGRLRALGTGTGDSCCCPSGGGTEAVRQTVKTVSRRWSSPPSVPSAPGPVMDKESCCCKRSVEPRRVEGAIDLDSFVDEAAARSFTISAMAFQDAGNLDLERLKGCCISVISGDGKLIPFCAYNLTSREGKSLYRQ